MAVRTVMVGERVVLDFAERDRQRRGPAYKMVAHYGTVTAFDERGIYIDLDVPANGLWDCYATYGEVSHAGARASESA